MKRVFRAFVGSALCLSLAGAVALAAPARASQPRTPALQSIYTVADFAADLLAAMGVQGRTPDSAITALRDRGIVARNADRPATEGDIVNLLSQAGIRVVTASPERSVSREQSREIIRAFGPQLSSLSQGPVEGCVGCDEGRNNNPVDDFNNGNGGGGKFKRKKKNSQTGSD